MYCVWTTFLSVEVQRSCDRKEKIYFGVNIFSLIFVFLKKFDWFGMIHQWVYTRMMIKKNNLQNRFFFEKEFWITLLSLVVQSANTKKRETVFRVLFLVLKKYFQENCNLNGSVKIIKEVLQEQCKKTLF